MVEIVIGLAVAVALVTGGVALWNWRRGPAKSRLRAAVRVALVSLLLLPALWYATYAVMNSRTFQFGGRIVSRVETSAPLVALTFDDGPSAGYTEDVLAVLAGHGVRATFFTIGQNTERNMVQARQLVAAGHELGNHTYSHQRMIFKDPAFVWDEMDRTDVLIRQAGYGGTISVRSPNCKKLVVFPLYLAQTERLNVTFDVEPDSIAGIAEDAEKMVDYTMRTTRPGSIILLHAENGSRDATRHALPRIIEGLQARGYRFVTVSELLAAPG
jgi:peptidoglycan-N-acetylglucosamine deacetylase